MSDYLFLTYAASGSLILGFPQDFCAGNVPDDTKQIFFKRISDRLLITFEMPTDAHGWQHVTLTTNAAGKTFARSATIKPQRLNLEVLLASFAQVALYCHWTTSLILEIALPAGLFRELPGKSLRDQNRELFEAMSPAEQAARIKSMLLASDFTEAHFDGQILEVSVSEKMLF